MSQNKAANAKPAPKLTCARLAAAIDHTLLKPATKRQITALCAEAAANNFASVCVHPSQVKLAACLLAPSPAVKVCTVVGFPLGQSTTRVKVFETKDAVKNGAREIDMVINQNFALANEWKKVEKEIAAVVRAARAAAEGVIVKVIIETCLLSPKQIAAAAKACAAACADFVKTSTGFSTGGATVAAVQAISAALEGTSLKIKASGGIRSLAAAEEYLALGVSRIGTSSGVEIISAFEAGEKE